MATASKYLLCNYFILILLSGFVGCEVLPIVRDKPTLHNPYPQLTNVAVVPFFNQSGNPKVNGRDFAKYYANELQNVPCFKVIANETVEKMMIKHELFKFESADDIRYLGQLLGVDAVVIGKIHDFSGYYPPRLKLETEWYAVNPYLHPIPPGHGEAWGTEFETQIPDKIVLLAEHELAVAQLKTQTPDFEPIKSPTERQKIEQEQQRRQNRPNSGVDETESQNENNQFNTEKNKYNSNLQHGLHLIHQQQPISPKPAERTAKRKNPIIQAATTDSEDDFDENSMDEKTFQELAANYKQDHFLNNALKSTGTPYIPNATPLNAEDTKRKAINKIRPKELGWEHPLKYGPWQSQQHAPNQAVWSQQNQYQIYQNQMLNNGQFNGHYAGYPMPEELTPEQIAQYGWLNYPVGSVTAYQNMMPGMPVTGQLDTIYGEPSRFPGLPADWPDPRGLIPETPQPEKPKRTQKSDAPVLAHIAIYNGNSSEFMQALNDYDLLFRDDKRLAGKESILNNTAEFITFCCRMHIWEMLSARGGSGPAEKVIRIKKPWQGGERPY
ncbi:MAG: hypothetical protein LBC74_00660 [Planctomycetaceae bacterium]|jgi:hypothetical protein|nr:hypothetical protein [Planctomycetaceae bacterium]